MKVKQISLSSISMMLALLFLTVAVAPTADAIPAFARKYETSCHTCHVAYPKLNPFGKAFRLRGYRMPAETEEMVKEEPIVLEQDAYRRMWPEALWPNDMPGTVPLSLDLQLSSVTSHDADVDATVSNDFRFPEGATVLAGGTLGELLSFLASVELAPQVEHGEAGVDVGISHAELHFNGPFDTGTAFNLKVGRFTPEATQNFSHGHLLAETLPNVIFGYNPIGTHGSREISIGHAGGGHHGGGGGGISLPAGVDGIEAYGVLGHRFQYSAGVANGMGPGESSFDANSAKDIFGRVAYKFGGMALDGENYEPSEDNWSETSLQLGAFAYRGDGENLFIGGFGGHHSTWRAEDREFTRYGVDVNVYLGDLNLIGGYVAGDDTIAIYDQPADDHGDDGGHEDDNHGDDDHGGGLELMRINEDDYKAAFVEADYVLYPWLHAGLRYEWLRPSSTREGDFKLTTANLTGLIRSNVKAILEFARVVGGPGEDDYQVRGGLRFAF